MLAPNFQSRTRVKKLLFQVPACMARVLWAVTFSIAAARSFPAQLHVPAPYANVSAAYAAAPMGETNFIDIAADVYLEPLTLFDAGKPVVLRPVGGRVVLAPERPPANDTAGGATPLSGHDASSFAYNYSAQQEPLDLELKHQGYTNFGRSMWWSWTAPTAGQAIFAVTDYEFPPLIDVFRSSNGLPVALPEADFLWQSNTEAGLVVYAGTNYLVRVAADNAKGVNHGGASIHVVMPAPPPNDLRTNALVLTGFRSRVAGNTYAASSEPGEPVHAGVGAGRSVWYVWTAPTNTGWGAHPLTATTAGSDFDTVLAVYTNNRAGGLDLVVANDNVSPFEHYSRVTFVPQPAQTYFFALDGAGPRDDWPRRSFVGNYSLRLDYSWINLTPNLISFIDPNGDGNLHMTADFAVTHHGFVAAGPLRIRLVARTTNSISGVHLLSAAGESNLLTFPVTLSSSGPGGFASVRTNFVRPPPFYPEGEDRLSFWGVFAILEERNDTNWFQIDNDFVGFGDPPSGAEGGLNFGVGRFYQPLAETEASVVEYTQVVGPLFATDQSTAEVLVAATISVRHNGQMVNEDRAVVPVRWLVPTNFPFVPGNTNGTSVRLVIGELPSSTSIRIDAEVHIGGLAYPPVTLGLPIYKRPTLTAARSQPSGAMLLTVFTEPQRRYQLQWATSLSATNTAWLPLGTNWFLSTNGAYHILVPTTEAGARFYRALLLP